MSKYPTYKKTTQIIPIDWSLPQIHQAVLLPPSTYMPLLPSRHVAIQFKEKLSDNYKITLTTDKYFGLANICQRKLEGNTTVGRMGEALSPVIPIIQGTCFCSLSTVINTKEKWQHYHHYYYVLYHHHYYYIF
jgi:hypothetical protein